MRALRIRAAIACFARRGTSAAGFGYSSPWSAATVSHGNLPRLELP